MTFLKTWLETNETPLQIECESPVSNTREHLHIHPYQENRFQIISGELTFLIDARVSKAKKGEIVSIPKNIAHEFWNNGTENAVYIQEFGRGKNVRLDTTSVLSAINLVKVITQANLVSSFYYAKFVE
ncbi:MAG: cupin domain-containing protein [Bacteroidia bacterium]